MEVSNRQHYVEHSTLVQLDITNTLAETLLPIYFILFIYLSTDDQTVHPMRRWP